MRRAIPVVLAAVLVLAGCGIIPAALGGSSHPVAPPPAVPKHLTPAAACDYLNLDHVGQVPFPHIPQLRRVAAGLQRTRAGRSFRAVVRRLIAAERATHSLRGALATLPAMMNLMARCAAATHLRGPARRPHKPGLAMIIPAARPRAAGSLPYLAGAYCRAPQAFTAAPGCGLLPYPAGAYCRTRLALTAVGCRPAEGA